MMQVWQIMHKGDKNLNVAFQGSVSNHSRAVNCVRFHGAVSHTMAETAVYLQCGSELFWRITEYAERVQVRSSFLLETEAR